MSSNRKRRVKAEINVVPYIDVMLVLLVIFIVASPSIKRDQSVNVNLPQADAAPYVAEKENLPVIVSIDGEGLFYLSTHTNPEEPLDAKTLTTKIAALVKFNKDKDIMIRGDKTIAYGQFMAVIGLLQNAGADNVGLMADPMNKLPSNESLTNESPNDNTTK